jgi:Spy/CpxP family protein refolding chaperone
MKRTLIALTTAAILILGSTCLPGSQALASSSPTQPSGQRREAFEKFKAALEQLNLTPDQKTQIKSIVKNARAQLKALKGQTGDQSQRREIIKQAREQIIALLTPAQKAQLKQILKSERTSSKNG